MAMVWRSIFLFLLTICISQSSRKWIVAADDAEDYDFIIVGAGTSGSVVAHRLSEDPRFRILVLEAGGFDLTEKRIQFPKYWPKLQRTSLDWNYKTQPYQYTNAMVPGQREQWPRGKVLGGSSTISAMMYARGSPHDFDSWEDHGASGWSWKDVEPFFRKLEGATDEQLSSTLGREGPVKLSTPYLTKMHYLFAEAGEEIGFNYTDYHDSLEGVSPLVMTVHKGKRVSAATAYLHPILDSRQERLKVTLNALVTKILCDTIKGKVTAVGVEYTKDGKSHTARASKEVIISAGVIETPHLLMRSGLGPSRMLTQNEIETKVDIRGVGRNLQDHQLYFAFFHASNMSDDVVITSKLIRESLTEYIDNGTGPWVTPDGLDTAVHFSTSLAGTNKSLSSATHPFPEIQMYLFSSGGEQAVFPPPRKADNDKSVSFAIAVNLMHPKSKGSVRLSKSTAGIAIYPNTFANDDDFEVMLEAVKTIEKLEQTEVFRQLGVSMIPPPYCDEHLPVNAPPRSEEYYKCLIRARTYTSHHPCCTAKMGRASSSGAVVDNRLRVHDVARLRIADASVMPHQLSTNTMAACFMIGERAAHFIKEDLRKTGARRVSIVPMFTG